MRGIMRLASHRLGIRYDKARCFCRQECGSTTVEMVIWLPIFIVIIALIVNVSLVFFNESQMLRIVQDGNRGFSLGRLEDTNAVQEYVQSRLSSFDANLTVKTTISDGFVTTSLDVPISALMPLNIMKSAFSGTTLNVRAQHIVEF